jgi:hypothetical protein
MMSKPLELRLEPKPRTAGRRPKGVGVKTVSTASGGKRRLFLLDANSASFGEDFLYVFSRNVKAARAATRALKARLGKGPRDPGR